MKDHHHWDMMERGSIISQIFTNIHREKHGDRDCCCRCFFFSFVSCCCCCCSMMIRMIHQKVHRYFFSIWIFSLFIIINIIESDNKRAIKNSIFSSFFSLLLLLASHLLFKVIYLFYFFVRGKILTNQHVWWWWSSEKTKTENRSFEDLKLICRKLIFSLQISIHLAFKSYCFAINDYLLILLDYPEKNTWNKSQKNPFFSSFPYFII